MFLKVIFVTFVLKIFLKISKFYCRKTSCLAVSRLISRMDALPYKSQKDLRKFQFLHKFRQRVSRLIHECFATHSRVLCDSNLAYENLPCAFAHFASNSRVACKSLTCEMCKKSVLKGLN